MICKECKQVVDGDFVFMQQHWTAAHAATYKALTKWAEDGLAVASGGLHQVVQRHGMNRMRGPDYGTDTIDRRRYHKHVGPLNSGEE